MTDDYDMPPEAEALRETARWLIAAYGNRLNAITLVLHGYHYWGRRTEYHGVDVTAERGCSPEGAPEDRLTLPTMELQDLAEALMARLVPGLRFTHENYDLQEHGYERLRRDDVSAHERLALIGRHGTLEEVQDRPPPAEAASGRQAGA